MTPQQKLDALKRLKPGKLAARCPVKPKLPPARFDWNRKWPQFMAGYKGQTVAQFIASDDRADTLKAMATKLEYQSTKDYVESWDAARNLIPAMEFITPTHGNFE